MQAVQPPPLPVHFVNLTLQYLLPPTAPIPIHLLSRELIQRHHFLNISPDDPAAYFCWSSFGTSSSTSIIQDLELRAGNEALLNKEVHDITYEPDEEGARARVKLAGDLDLYILFVWRGSEDSGCLGDDGWRYYDTKRLPSVAPASLIVDDDRSHAPVPDLEPRSFNGHVGGFDQDSSPPSPSSDAYWDNYGAAHSSDSSPCQNSRALPSTHGNGSTMDGDAAYWAAYSVVQGSADSTIPSRVPSLQKLNTISSGDEAHGYRQYDGPGGRSRYGQNDDKNDCDEPLVVEAVRPRWQDSLLDQLGPASSAATAHDHLTSDSKGDVGQRILHRFSPEREDRQQERERKLSEERDASDATALARALFPVVSYQKHLGDLEQQSPKVVANTAPELETITDGARRLPDTADTVSGDAGQVPSSQSTAARCEAETKPSSVTVGAVEEAVRGVYRLWLNQNQYAADNSATAEKFTREVFLALVADAISSA